MTVEVLLAVLFAALLHAIWNGLIKVDDDGMSAMTVIVAIQAVISIVLMAFVPWPAKAGWPFLFGAVFLHAGYRVFLVEAYRFGNLGRVYPISRGSSPLIVSLLALLVAGETMGLRGWTSVVIIAVGIMSLALVRDLDPVRDGRAVALALVSGVLAAIYTVVDALGARHSGSASAYMIWVTFADAVVFLPLMLCWKGTRMHALATRRTWVAGAVAGATGFIAYWMIIWALSVAPIGLVSAARSTSIAFATLLGIFFFKEPLTLLRGASVIAIAVGTALLKVGH